LTCSLKAPGFTTLEAWNVISWVQSFAFQMGQLVPLRSGEGGGSEYEYEGGEYEGEEGDGGEYSEYGGGGGQGGEGKVGR
jgi:hypothetical protein